MLEQVNVTPFNSFCNGHHFQNYGKCRYQSTETSFRWVSSNQFQKVLLLKSALQKPNQVKQQLPALLDTAQDLPDKCRESSSKEGNYSQFSAPLVMQTKCALLPAHRAGEQWHTIPSRKATPLCIKGQQVQHLNSDFQLYKFPAASNLH